MRKITQRLSISPRYFMCEVHHEGGYTSHPNHVNFLPREWNFVQKVLTNPQLWVIQIPHSQNALFDEYWTIICCMHVFENRRPSHCHRPFAKWCQTYRVQLHMLALPYIQLGPFLDKMFSFLSYSLKWFLFARRHIIDGLADWPFASRKHGGSLHIFVKWHPKLCMQPDFWGRRLIAP